MFSPNASPNGSIEMIPLRTHSGVGGNSQGLEPLVAFLQILPELTPWAFLVSVEILRCQAEGEQVDSAELLTVVEGMMNESEDLFDFVIPDGKASD